MATWRYSKHNSAELALANATGPVNHSSEQSPSKIFPETFDDENSEDFSYSDLDDFPCFLAERANDLKSLNLDHNLMTSLPSSVGLYTRLLNLDLSNNQLKTIADEVCCLVNLRSLILRNNQLTSASVPKDFGTLPSLQLLNVSGNRLTDLPIQFTELRELKCLYLGANRIASLPREIGNLHR